MVYHIVCKFSSSLPGQVKERTSWPETPHFGKPKLFIPSIDGIPYGALIWDGFYIKTSRTGRSSVKIEHIGPRFEVTDKSCAWVRI